MFFKKFFSKLKKEERLFFAPENTVIYAIGDVHGRLDLLDLLHEKIKKDAERKSADNKIVIYLGDYIDRGRESKGVIDRLINNPLSNFDKIYLKGNHEIGFQAFMNRENQADAWLLWGGDATLCSYQVDVRGTKGQKVSPDKMAEQLRKNLPQSHEKFYKSLKLCHILGDYIFVHAGLRPKVDFNQQSEKDITTIREEFIFSRYDFGKKIVFGHSVFSEPLNTANKLGIDTGAYASGVLTCAVLESKNIEFITT